MSSLTDEMLRAVIIETETLSAGLLNSYRHPPGRKPSETQMRLRDALATLDDEVVEMLIRDVLDAAVFQMIYLMGNGFKSDLDVEISRGNEREQLMSALYEDYRAYIEPGGVQYRKS
ncbi:hypothetical protein [Erythrobacter sp.]|jgi:hypothetical protein|uniref:hypothetical protein n=1 Tax=Erythrobacter sp. TaxID=1042 RepID=UPI002EBC4988|nr:hypothetical protein [Erythrobacter sp.]